MSNIKDIIKNQGKFVIGMVHCLPLPGSLNYSGSMDEIVRQAVADAQSLERSGIDAIMVENMGDDPFLEKLEIAQIVGLSIVAQKVKDSVSVPVGIDAAFNDFETSIAIASAIKGDFIRVPVFVDTVSFYGGSIKPCARDCTLYRKCMSAQDVMILADIQVKHTNMILPHISIESSAKEAEACLADAIIVTGTAIGEQTPIELIDRVKKVVKIPVIAGSGVKPENIKEQLNIADGAIVGSSLKEGGKLSNPISSKLVKELMNNL